MLRNGRAGCRSRSPILPTKDKSMTKDRIYEMPNGALIALDKIAGIGPVMWNIDLMAAKAKEVFFDVYGAERFKERVGGAPIDEVVTKVRDYRAALVKAWLNEPEPLETYRSSNPQIGGE